MNTPGVSNDQQLLCPHCHYDLRGTLPADPNARFTCPECGRHWTRTRIERGEDEPPDHSWTALLLLVPFFVVIVSVLTAGGFREWEPSPIATDACIGCVLIFYSGMAIWKTRWERSISMHIRRVIMMLLLLSCFAFPTLSQ